MKNEQNKNSSINSDLENIQPEVSDLEKEESLKTKKLQAFAVVAIALIALILMIFSFFGKKEEPVVKERQVGTQVKTKSFDLKEEAKNFKEIIEDIERKEEEKTAIPTMQLPTEEEPKENIFSASISKTIEPKVYKGSSMMMVNNTGSKREMPIDPTDGNYAFDSEGNIVEKGSSFQIGELEKNYEEGVFRSKAAKVIEFDPNLLLKKGTFISCSLDTRLVSTIAGNIGCTVSENIYSANGTTLLIEKGSKINGFFRSGQLNDGMDRIFVVWNEIRTPNNIIIPISSGATDELGGTGIQGYVDHHWLQRFGAAILLSIIDDAMNVALNGGVGTRNNQNRDYVDNTSDTVEEMAAIALEKFINIQPTLYRNHGDIVGIYVNRDVDFSSVYKLTTKKRARIIK